ncbi:hypothetical protein D3C80_1349840 [compost metagenome]
MLFRVANKGLDDGQNVFDAVVQFLVQHTLAHFCALALACHKLAVMKSYFHQCYPGGFRHVPVSLRPRLSLQFHRFFPDGKALAWCEAVSHRTCFIGFFRISSPVESLDQLLAEKQKIFFFYL